MDFLPFKIYSAPFPKDKYGLIYEIPEYCTQKELEKIQETTKSHIHYGSIPAECYPNVAVDYPDILEKTQYIFDNRLAVYSIMRNTLDTDYRFLSRESRKCRVSQRIQGSPRGMEEYPPHIDGGKLMTILFPLSPVKCVPTSFSGLNDSHWKVSIPWKINHAYLFCSSSYSYHSYIGDPKNDRWVFNINILEGEKQVTGL